MTTAVQLRSPWWWPLIGLFLGLTSLSTFSLYVMSTRTDELFAWTIAPPLSAAFLGAGYGAGFLLILLTALDRIWAHNHIALSTITLFVWLTMVPTLIHLDRFHFDAPGGFARFTAWLWTLVYLVIPVWMALLLLWQRRMPGGDPPVARPLPGLLNVVLGLQAAVMLGVGALLMTMPGWVDGWWPWALTPLVGRTVGAWFIALGFAAVLVILRRDLARFRAPSATYVAFGILQLAALIRFSADVRWERPATWAWLVLLGSMIAVGCYGWIRGRPNSGGHHLASTTKRRTKAGL